MYKLSQARGRNTHIYWWKTNKRRESQQRNLDPRLYTYAQDTTDMQVFQASIGMCWLSNLGHMR